MQIPVELWKALLLLIGFLIPDVWLRNFAFIMLEI